MYLIQGQWYDWWTDELMDGGKEIYVEAPLDKIPMFVKAGAVLPFNPVMQYVGEKVVEELTLHVYFKNGEEQSEFYEDRGEGYDYKDGEANVKHFYTTGSENQFTIRQEKSGGFKPEYSTYEVVIHGLPFEPSRCRIGAEVLTNENLNKNEKGQFVMNVKEGFSEIIIE